MKNHLAYLFLICICLFYFGHCFANNSSLAKYGMTEYPDKKDLNAIVIPQYIKCIQTLSSSDINEQFSNIDDLLWLKSIAQNKQVVLFGESHWSQTIYNLRNRILFTLNTYDRFPIILIEREYSESAFFDYYVNISDDKEAHFYYQKTIYEMVDTKEMLIFLEHIRRWNNSNPEKIIQIGCYDVEHDGMTLLKNVIIPYFQQVDPSFNFDFKYSESYQAIVQLFEKLKDLLPVAVKNNIVGEFEFLTPQYIKTIMENMELSFLYFSTRDRSYRSKAMINNLTNDDTFGKYFKSGKVMIHAGSAHTITHLPHREGESFYREGSYLTYDYEPTKGRTFSIAATALAYSIGGMSDVGLDSLVFHAYEDYDKMIKKYQSANDEGLVSKNINYVFNNTLLHFRDFIFKLSYSYNFQPMLMDKINWDTINDDLRKEVIDNDIFGHDINIFIPKTPIVTVNPKKL